MSWPSAARRCYLDEAGRLSRGDRLARQRRGLQPVRAGAELPEIDPVDGPPEHARRRLRRRPQYRRRGLPDARCTAQPGRGSPSAGPAWARRPGRRSSPSSTRGEPSQGKGSLDGPTQTLPALYSLPATDFNTVEHAAAVFALGRRGQSRSGLPSRRRLPPASWQEVAAGSAVRRRRSRPASARRSARARRRPGGQRPHAPLHPGRPPDDRSHRRHAQVRPTIARPIEHRGPRHHRNAATPGNPSPPRRPRTLQRFTTSAAPGSFRWTCRRIVLLARRLCTSW